MWFSPPISETKKVRYRAMHWLVQGHSAAEPTLELAACTNHATVTINPELLVVAASDCDHSCYVLERCWPPDGQLPAGTLWSWRAVMHAWNAHPWFLHLINSSSRLGSEDTLFRKPWLSSPAQCSHSTPKLTSVAAHTALCLPASLHTSPTRQKFLKDGHSTLHLSVPST